MRHEREMWELAKALAIRKGIINPPQTNNIAGYGLTSTELTRLYRRYGFTNLDVISRHTAGWLEARMAYKFGDIVFFNLSDSIWDAPALSSITSYGREHPGCDCVGLWGDLLD